MYDYCMINVWIWCECDNMVMMRIVNVIIIFMVDMLHGLSSLISYTCSG